MHQANFHLLHVSEDMRWFYIIAYYWEFLIKLFEATFLPKGERGRLVSVLSLPLHHHCHSLHFYIVGNILTTLGMIIMPFNVFSVSFISREYLPIIKPLEKLLTPYL